MDDPRSEQHVWVEREGQDESKAAASMINVSVDPDFDSVLQALASLYEAYSARDADGEDELHRLMEAYDKWLG